VITEISANGSRDDFSEMVTRQMPSARSLFTRPWRRLRRWSNRTPNDQLAFSLLGFGCLLVLVAALVLSLDRGWM
jgi:hypothetical protein